MGGTARADGPSGGLTAVRAGSQPDWEKRKRATKKN